MLGAQPCDGPPRAARVLARGNNRCHRRSLLRKGACQKIGYDMQRTDKRRL